MVALHTMSHRGNYLTICYEHTYRLHQSFVSGLPSFAVPRIPSNNVEPILTIRPHSRNLTFLRPLLLLLLFHQRHTSHGS